MIYAINYDLHRPGQSYEELFTAIKQLGAWWHYLGSTWLVDTSLTAQQIWASLQPHADTNDTFFIAGISQDYSGWMPTEAWAWLNERKYKMAA